MAWPSCGFCLPGTASFVPVAPRPSGPGPGRQHRPIAGSQVNTSTEQLNTCRFDIEQPCTTLNSGRPHDNNHTGQAHGRIRFDPCPTDPGLLGPLPRSRPAAAARPRLRLPDQGRTQRPAGAAPGPAAPDPRSGAAAICAPAGQCQLPGDAGRCQRLPARQLGLAAVHRAAPAAWLQRRCPLARARCRHQCAGHRTGLRRGDSRGPGRALPAPEPLYVQRRRAAVRRRAATGRGARCSQRRLPARQPDPGPGAHDGPEPGEPPDPRQACRPARATDLQQRLRQPRQPLGRPAGVR
ncbi:hypothetical protein D3C75_757860 [compost metagenome]